jgi:uroporphyrinogen-III synthase
MGMAKQSSPDAVPDPVPVLLTRPEAQSQEFAKALVTRFGARVRPVIAPLMAVEYLSPPLPEGAFSGVIFTSANGIDAAARVGAELPVRAWCVGQGTAALARSAGFVASSADGNADALVSAILANPPPGRLLHLCGEETRGDVAERLNSAGIETESTVLYRMRPQALTAEATELLQGTGIVIVPLFSPRSATLLNLALPPGRSLRLQLVAMSAAIKDAVAVPHAELLLVRKPNANAVLDAIGELLEKVAPP